MSVNIQPDGDEDLMVRVKADDVQAFEQFHDRHSSLAFSLAMRILNDRGRAAEATQEAFLGLWQQRARYTSDRGSGRSWLLSMVRNRSIDMWRREQRHNGDLIGEAHIEAQPALDDIEEQSIANGERRRVRGTLRQIPAEQRRVVELAYFRGLTHTEIAELLGLPLGTAKGRMRLGLSKLRAELAADSGRQIPASPLIQSIRRGA